MLNVEAQPEFLGEGKVETACVLDADVQQQSWDKGGVETVQPEFLGKGEVESAWIFNVEARLESTGNHDASKGRCVVYGEMLTKSRNRL